MIRLQDIADMAGVSRTTVSNVINGNTKRVSQSTIDRITAILKEQNYVPHMGSVMLSGHGSRIIGVVLGFSFIHGMQSLQDSFVGEITGTLQVEAENRGYYIMLIGGEKIDNVVDMASRWNVEGLIIIGYNEERYHQLSRKLNKKMVLIDAYHKGEYSSCLTKAASYGRGKGTCRKKCKKPCLACKERFCKRVAESLFLFCDDFSWDIIGI